MNTFRIAAYAAMAATLAAIEVCKERAPVIAHTAGEAAGAEVGRTALKLRNPANAPDAWQREVLESFAVELASSADDPAPERLVRLPDGRLRYMRAILTEGPCLACHGESLAEPVAAAIDALYPDDAARGFRIGELRGAFTVTWPAEP